MKMFSKLNNFFSSVKLAIFLFIAIAAIAMIGTFINQGNTINQYKKIFGPAAYHILYRLGFLNIYDSWYFIGLAALLIVNLVFASANIFPQTLKAVFGPFPSFKETLDKKTPKGVFETLESKKTAEEIKKNLNLKFGKPFVKKQGDNGGSTELYYSKNSVFRFSPFIAHLSVIIIIVGVLLNFKYGFRSYTNIKVGEKTNVSYLLKNQKPVKLPFVIRLDKYQTKYYPDRIPKAYISTISIIKNHVTVLTKNMEVNHPVTYDGITIYQASYGHYKPTKVIVRILSLNLKNPAYRKYINAAIGKSYPAGVGGISFSFIPYKHPKKGRLPFYLNIIKNDKKNAVKKVRFHILPDKNLKEPMIFAKYKHMVFLYTGIAQVKTYYYSGMEISKNKYVSLVWIGCIILIVSMFFAFFFNQAQTWVRLTEAEGGKKTIIEIISVPKKKFESFYKRFNKNIADIKKELGG